MKSLIPTPSMAVAFLALIVALSGSAYAVSKVGTKQIKSNAVTTPKIKNGAVTSSKLKGSAVTSSRIKDGAVTSPEIGNGAVTSSKIAPGLVPKGAGVVDDIQEVTLTPLGYTDVIVQDLEARADQILTVSATVQTELVGGAEPSHTFVRCRAVARFLQVPLRNTQGFVVEEVMTPVSEALLVEFGGPTPTAPVPVVGQLVVNQSGTWRVTVECATPGPAGAKTVNSSIVLLAADA